ncbi:MAG: hypothetical protein P8K64_03490 [Acidimicrobiales bacterium]|nr:hypothetical protein [Acidimicrobiales bacterium]
MRRTKLSQYFLLGGLLVAGVLTGILHPSALIFLLVAWTVIMLISKAAERYGRKDR